MPTEIPHHLPARATIGPTVDLLALVAKTVAGAMEIAQLRVGAGHRKIAADRAHLGCTVHAAMVMTVVPLRPRRQIDTAPIEIGRMETGRIASASAAMRPRIVVHRAVDRRHAGMPMAVTRCITTVCRRRITPRTELMEIDTDDIGMKRTETTRIMVLRPPSTNIAARRATIAAARTSGPIEGAISPLRITLALDRRTIDPRAMNETKTAGRRAGGTAGRRHRLPMRVTGDPMTVIVRRHRAASATKSNRIAHQAVADFVRSRPWQRVTARILTNSATRNVFQRGGYARPGHGISPWSGCHCLSIRNASC